MQLLSGSRRNLYIAASAATGVVVSIVSHLRLELRIKLNAVEADLEALLAKMGRGEPSTEQLVQANLQRVIHQLEVKRQSRVAAEADVREWQRKQRDAPSVGGIDPLPSSSVEDRKEFATRARRYAYSAMEIASGAIDEAICAALEAWLVEHDVAQAEARERLP